MKILKIILLFGLLSSSAFATSLGEGEPDCTAINGSITPADAAGGTTTTDPVETNGTAR